MADFDPALEFSACFGEEICARALESSVPPELWKTAGRPSQTYPQGEDEAWWRRYGPRYVRSYVTWREAIDWEIWETPDGEPAIELDLLTTFGVTPVRAILDRVFVTQDGELVVVDVKTGKVPTDGQLQLGWYASAIEAKYGIRPSWCAYWLARSGGLSKPYHPDQWTPEYLGELLSEFTFARDAGIYIPNPTRLCDYCGVRDECPAMGRQTIG